MYTIENRSKNPRVFIDQLGRGVTVGVNKSREVDLDKGTATFLQAQNEVAEEAGQDPEIIITGSAEKPPSESVRVKALGKEVTLEGEGDDLEEDELTTKSRRRPAKKAKAKRSKSKRASSSAEDTSGGENG